MSEKVFEGEVLRRFDETEVERLLYEHDGSIRQCARELGASSLDLRLYVGRSERLQAALGETFALGVDEATEVLFEGLRDKGSFQNRFYAAKEFVKSAEGRRRGFGVEPSGAATLELKGDKGGTKTIVLRWLDPNGSEEKEKTDET
jgi:hypothetical protein